jgi:hypothetical protein
MPNANHHARTLPTSQVTTPPLRLCPTLLLLRHSYFPLVKFNYLTNNVILNCIGLAKEQHTIIFSLITRAGTGAAPPLVLTVSYEPDDPVADDPAANDPVLYGRLVRPRQRGGVPRARVPGQGGCCQPCVVNGPHPAQLPFADVLAGLGPL